MQRILSLALAIALVMTSCGSDDPTTDDSTEAASVGASSASLDGDWILDFLLIEGDMAIPLPAEPLDFRIDGDTFGGSAGCNSMGGSASFSADGTVIVGDAFMTEMACADQSLMEFEQLYARALPLVTAWNLDDDRLTLTGPGTEIVYVVRTAPPDAPLIGTTWTLDTFFDADTAMTAAGMENVSITFGDTGVRAQGSCWTIDGVATIEPGGEGNLRMDFTSSDPDFTCDDRAFFDEMIERLSAVAEYEIDELRLTLGAADQPILGLRS